jgi:hypothetical protein
MLWNALIVLVLVLLAIETADARMPQVGDNVRITTTVRPISFEGTITDIGDGLICLHCNSNNYPNNFDSGQDSSKPFDVCIGVGSILGLIWV